MSEGGRGPVATADMKARVRAGWTVSDLWDRMQAAENGDGYVYDMAETLPNASACTEKDILNEAREVTTTTTEMIPAGR